MGIVDTHVHCRDSRYNFEAAEYVSHALSVAGRAGVDAVFDMPNTSPPIISRDQVADRLYAAESFKSNVFYGLHIGLTSDPEQIREAVETYKEFFPGAGDKAGVVGLKMFAGRSTGDLAIIDEEEQENVYRTLGDCKYGGVLVVHCEKESFMNPTQFYPGVPQTHSFARPGKAEVASVRDQIRFAYENDFSGTLHIAHVSLPKTVDEISIAQSNYGYNDVRSMRITCGATPHHLFLSHEMMKDGTEGLVWKVNPPLRAAHEQKGLLDRLKMGRINWIETDHAPHWLENKIGEPYMSGIPGLDSWPKVIERLRREGFSDGKIQLLTRDNALAVYGIPKGVVINTEGTGDLELNEYPYGYGDALLK